MEKNKTINQIIKDSLGMNDETLLTESYVASEQKFNLPTEFLSASNKKNHEELYASYIKNFNEISARLDTVDRDSANSNNSEFRSLKLDESFNMNAVYLHELYFANISDLESKIQMDSLSYIKLSNDFGSFENWQKDFIACCMSSRCGWACTVLNTYLQAYQNIFLDLHSLNFPVGTYPVIVMV
jgi:Fe-Mn family superoxide dismutase